MNNYNYAANEILEYLQKNGVVAPDLEHTIREKIKNEIVKIIVNSTLSNIPIHENKFYFLERKINEGSTSFTFVL